MKIAKIKKLGKNQKQIRSATTETFSNKIVETEQVDDSVTVIELSHASDMSEISFSVEEEISSNENLNPLQHLYENDETSKISPTTLLEERSPYFSASKFSSMDYRVIFKSSCVPQIIASAAGNIIACNDAYLNLTNQIHKGACRSTMFSVIKPDALFKLYKYVASVLKHTKREIGDEDEISTLQDYTNFDSSSSFPCEEILSLHNACSMKVTPILEENFIQYFHCSFSSL